MYSRLTPASCLSTTGESLLQLGFYDQSKTGQPLNQDFIHSYWKNVQIFFQRIESAGYKQSQDVRRHTSGIDTTSKRYYSFT